MKEILTVLKNELVNVNWRSEFDALGTLHGLYDVKTGKSTYYCMRSTEFALNVHKEKLMGKEYIRIEYTHYKYLEERRFKISTELFDRFVDALKDFAEETEKDRLLNRYKYEVMRRRDDDPDSDKKPTGLMIKH